MEKNNKKKLLRDLLTSDMKAQIENSEDIRELSIKHKEMILNAKSMVDLKLNKFCKFNYNRTFNEIKDSFYERNAVSKTSKQLNKSQSYYKLKSISDFLSNLHNEY